MLGELAFEVDGVGVPLGGSLSRRLVAGLSTGDGFAVGDELLAEYVWRDGQPANAVRALRVMVWRLRSTGIGQWIRRMPAGYALVVPAGQTDHAQFAAAVNRGLQQLRGDDAVRAEASLESALALWRGTPWADLGDSPSVAGSRARLEELRQVAVEELQAARLALGDVARAVPALEQAVAESPYRERRWELLVLGLCQAGRPERAIAELHRVRDLLADGVGLDPGPSLCALEHRLALRHRVPVRSGRWR
ncbi:BTAD domain-containing putative transcriptional regulator [Kribbella sp. NPDC051620]|uniref:AfsR/SARP family transcriptional regulator n=1 Tax=Kribbella sp. NPDC051620 TaxID=3364120 RepID=UPI00379A6622